MLSLSFRKALEFGIRYINFTGMDVTMMVNTIGKVDYHGVVELGELLKKKVETADEVIIKDANGTHLTAYNQGRAVRHSGQLATQKGFPIMLRGQISWCPVEETISGALVFDAALFPPATLGLLKPNVALTFEDGQELEKDGRYVDAEVVRICKKLGVDGY